MPRARGRSPRRPARGPARPARPAARGRPAAAAPARHATPPPSPPPTPRGDRPPPLLPEPPHAHIVCRVCGRIARVPLATEDELLLERLAGRRDPSWSLDGIAFSLTGACARCRQGRSV